MKEMSRTFKEKTINVHSLIKENFTKDFMKKIYNIYANKSMSIVEKTIAYDKLFTKEFGERKDYRRIGEGTNRFVCLLSNHIIKVAYNYLAYLDNMNELAMSKRMSKHGPLALAYETNGLVLVSEYVAVIDKEDFLESQVEVKKVLIELEQDVISVVNKNKNYFYILGDMGMSSKNYGNWGRRSTGELVILDYGYLYKSSFADWKEISKCPYCGNPLTYKDDYTELECSSCNKTVKYTTLRNNLGYKKIIENIKDINDNDKFGKFDKDGNVLVDVYKTETYEVEEKIPEIPQKVLESIDYTVNKFYEISYLIKKDIKFDKDEIIRELYESQNHYYVELYPMLLVAINMNKNNVHSYEKDFDNKVYDIKSLLLEEVKNSQFEKLTEEEYEEYNKLITEEDVGYDENLNQSNIEFIDKLSEEQDNVEVVSSLNDILNMEFGGQEVFMADENEDILDNLDENYNLDKLMDMVYDKEKNKEEEKVEEKDNTINIKDMLKESYKNLKESLMSIISDIMDTDDFVEGDNLYQPLLNGDLIDYDYSPEVNAENILGGWEPDKFCFPLYRHLLIMKNYDSTEAKEEFEAIYKIDDKDVKVPENMYDVDENIDTVLEQIATRFEEDVRPSRFALVLAIKKQLVEYYKHVDEYYENKMEQKMKTSLDSCDYYYKMATQSTEILKDMREAKGKMERELKDYLDMTLEESLGVNKLVYFYNYIELMDNIQDDIRTVICDIDIMSKHGNIKDIIKDIRNKYYEITRRLISDNKFDIFKYGPSYISEVGYKRELKPKLQCRLVDKDSNIDEYQPLIFTREKYRLLRIEKRFEKLFKANEVNLSDIVHKLDNRQLYYTITDIDKYVFKRNKDNLRYLMTEFEYNILSEYENLYGMTHMNDVDKLYADCIVNILNEKYNLCEDTYNLFKDIAHLGLNDALSIRYMIINMLDIQDISRLDYLNNIK